MSEKGNISQVLNVALAILLLIALAFTAYSINQVRSLETEAAKGGNTGAKSSGGKLTTTISLAVNSGGNASFNVTRSIPYDKNTIWVTNKCWDGDDKLVQRRDSVVIWGSSESLSGYTGSVPTGGVNCTAYVTLRPWQDKVLGEATVDYLPK
jgi:hypothetical protein